jgi:hypothetical protein
MCKADDATRSFRAGLGIGIKRALAIRSVIDDRFGIAVAGLDARSP